MQEVHTGGNPLGEVRYYMITALKRVLRDMAPLNPSARDVFQIIEDALEGRRGKNVIDDDNQVHLLRETIHCLRNILEEVTDAHRSGKRGKECVEAFREIDSRLINLALQYDECCPAIA